MTAPTQPLHTPDEAEAILGTFRTNKELLRSQLEQLERDWNNLCREVDAMLGRGVSLVNNDSVLSSIAGWIADMNPFTEALVETLDDIRDAFDRARAKIDELFPKLRLIVDRSVPVLSLCEHSLTYLSQVFSPLGDLYTTSGNLVPDAYYWGGPTKDHYVQSVVNDQKNALDRVTDHVDYLGVAPAARMIAAGSGIEPGQVQVEAAVRWLVDQGVGVVLVVDGAESLGPAAVAYALSRDTVVVVPHSEHPSAVPGVISVRGVRQREPPPSGAAPVLAAPGEINLMLGSSHAASASVDVSAAALVAGVVTLVRSRYPEADANTTIQRVLSTATTVVAEPSPYGRGLVSPVAALTADVPPVTGNPLGEPAGMAGSDRGAGRRRWVVVGVAAAGLSLLLVGLAAGVLYRRRRRAR